MDGLRSLRSMSFGYRTNWLAAQHQDKNRVAEILGMSDLQQIGWTEGLLSSEQDHVFISDEIQGWTLAFGQMLPNASDPLSQARLENILAQLSEKGEAVFFSNQPEKDYYAWAKADMRRVVRAYAYSGKHEAVYWSAGGTQVAELGLNLPSGLGFSSVEEEMGMDYPDEEMVMALAEKLSINPTKLSDQKDLERLEGWVARYPS